MLIQSILIEPSWKRMLEEEFGKPYFQKLSAFVHQEYRTRDIYPAQRDIFRTFDMCPFDKVTVVILGQDPYHGTQQANGLSFAVHTGIPLPPSLRNIFKEIENDVGITPLVDGDLSRWAQQGVLLLNATLTVQADNPGSHQNKGWESFTDVVIKTLSDQKEHVVFILWGNYAKDKGRCINRNRHLVIESPHPSPFSAHNGFFGSKPFSKTNEYLLKHDKPLIEWG
jgi:uracil-DNA glycosylase